MSVMRFDPFKDPFRSLDRLTSQLMGVPRAPMGVWQAEDGCHVALDLPWAGPGSVEVTTERNMLTIRAERRPDYEPRARREAAITTASSTGADQ